jgi:hypothetical protein
MRKFHRLCASLGLALIFAASVFAGDMQTGIAQPPTPTIAQRSTADRGTSAIPSATMSDYTALDSFKQLALTLFGTMLSRF